MIKHNNNSISSVYDETTVIEKIYKGTLKVYEGWRNLIASGIPPLTLLNCKGVDLVDYKIYGNSTQEGENLFDINSVTDVYISDTITRTGQEFTFDVDKTLIISAEVYNRNSYYRIKSNGVFSGTFQIIEMKTINLPAGDTLIIYSTLEKDLVGLKLTEAPTPDTPIEVESVGEKTKNLLDYTLVKTVTNVNLNGNLGGNNTIIDVNIPAGEMITASADIDATLAGSDNNSVSVVLTYDDDTTYTYNYWNAGCIKIPKGTKGRSYTTVTADKNVKKVSLTGHTFNGTEGGTTIFSNYQIEVGNSITYEPYGYRIPVKVSGKNLFNINDDFSDVKQYYSGNGYYGHKYTLKPNTTYTLSVSKNNITEYMTVTTDSWHNQSPTATYWISHKTATPHCVLPNQPKTFTTGNTGEVWINMTNGGNAEAYRRIMLECFENLQLEEDSSPTNYEPYIEPTTTNIYLNEPLRKVNDYVDYIDFTNKKVVRNIKYREFSENDSWSLYQTIANHFQVGVLDNYFNNGEHYIMSNYYPIRQSNKAYYDSVSDYAVLSVDGGRIRFKNKDYTTLEEWKNRLSTLDEKLYVIYRLRTPIEETIELPNIPTNKGTTILSVDTTIQPSNLVVVYKGKR